MRLLNVNYFKGLFISLERQILNREGNRETSSIHGFTPQVAMVAGAELI